ncbi:cytochrome P450 [Schizopora paradoxa]|uniref:Cytochrome P450 n=1 Tax=Schizopora paradoxa TaxID=27342 RepID=A0A0H2RYW8_9AGAM|nr:cytochrome P450 [Schizopora paradoxa]
MDSARTMLDLFILEYRTYFSTFVPLCVIILILLRPRARKPLPPGPRRWPIIGNISDFSEGLDATHWAKHKDVYVGPLSSAEAFGKTFIIVNDAKVASDLLDQVNYSHRPISTFNGKLCGFRIVPSMKPPGEQWRTFRKQFHSTLGTRTSVSVYHDMLEFESRMLLLNLMKSPDDFFKHLQTYAGATTLNLCFGYSVSRHGSDPLVKLARAADNAFDDSITKLWMVDLLPFLQYIPGWLPGMGFKEVAKHIASVFQEFRDRPFDFTKAQLAKGKAPASFVATQLEKSSGSSEEEEVIKLTASALYAGGSDTTVAALEGFMLAMTLNPEIVRKAQAEVDAVVGLDRLPQISDRSRMPYIDAIMKEVLRWQVPVPMSLPRATKDEDEYNGYRIPAGSTVLPNIWMMCHDPSRYHDPFEFRPERFLPDGERNTETDPKRLVFGFGRRICPGKEFAEASLFIAISMILTTFDISKAQDKLGREIVPRVENTFGALNHPKKFECRIMPRSENAVALIRTVKNESAYDLDDSGNLPPSNIC